MVQSAIERGDGKVVDLCSRQEEERNARVEW